MSSGPSPAPVLIAAMVVLLGGVAALVVHDDSSTTVKPPVLSSGLPSSRSSSSFSSTTRSSSVPLSTAPTTSFVASTVKPSVTSPEAAANGLWAAYAASNRDAARRFATDDVIRVLFEVPYNGEQGSFQSCRPQGDRFECLYTQPSSRYSMTVKADAAGSFEVVELTVTST